jgi:hypothetical protein
MAASVDAGGDGRRLAEAEPGPRKPAGHFSSIDR